MPNPAKLPLVLIPGLVCDRTVWEYQIVGLADVAEPVCIEWTTEESLPQFAETVLRAAPPRFALAGHSMGGRVALEVYRQAPGRVTRMALLNTGYKALAPGAAGEEEVRGRYALLEVARTQGMSAMARQWLPPMLHPARRVDAPLVEAIISMFARRTPEFFAAQIRAMVSRPDATPVLQSIRCPALLSTGQDDGWSPPDRHVEMSKMIPGSQLLVIPDCGHMSTMERPQAVTDALRQWLSD